MTRWYSRSWPTVGPGTGCREGATGPSGGSGGTGASVAAVGGAARARGRAGAAVWEPRSRPWAEPRGRAAGRERRYGSRACAGSRDGRSALVAVPSPGAVPCVAVPRPRRLGCAAAGAGSAAAGRPPRFTQSMQGLRLDHVPFGAPAAAEARIAPQAERGQPRNLSWTRSASPPCPAWPCPARVAVPRPRGRAPPRRGLGSYAISRHSITNERAQVRGLVPPRRNRPEAGIPSSMPGWACSNEDSAGRGGHPGPTAASQCPRISVSDAHSGIGE